MKEFKATSGGRLDVVLAKQLGISRQLAGALIKQGFVIVDGQRARRKSMKVTRGQRIVVLQLEKNYPHLTHEAQYGGLEKQYATLPSLNLLLIKPSYIVVDKPPVVVNRVGSPNLMDMLARMGYLPLLVHRLDRPVTGCILVATAYEAARRLSCQFAERRVTKRYVAIVHGRLTEKLKIEAPIYHTRTPLKRSIVSFGKYAETILTPLRIISLSQLMEALEKANIEMNTVRALDPQDCFSLVDIEIPTGRTHQIRVHLSYIGHPVVGDRRYGSQVVLRSRHWSNMEVVLLHSRLLGFTCPDTGEHVVVESQPPWLREYTLE